MKRFLLFGTALFALGFAACKQNDYTESTRLMDFERDKLAQYEQIGILHNQVLDTVLADIWKDKILTFNESKGDKPLTKSSTKETKRDRLIDVAYNAMERGLKNSFPEMTGEIIGSVASKEKFAADIKRPLTRDMDVNDEILNSLTPSQKQYYEKLKEIIDKQYKIEELLVRISILEEEIIKNVSETEWDALLCATSVARNSAQYWNEKVLVWNMSINGEINKEISIEELNTLGLIEQKSPLVKGIEYGPFDSNLLPGCYPMDDPRWYIWVTYDDLCDIGPHAPGVKIVAYICSCPPGLYFDVTICACTFPWEIGKEKEIEESDFNFWWCLGFDAGGALAGAQKGGTYFWFTGLGGAIVSSGGYAIGTL
jgi:hypothetical protein